MRTFPYEYEAKKETLFYPARPKSFSAFSLEIGPGRGDFLLSVAEKHPDKTFVAIELGKKRYHKLIPRIEKKGLTNILLICGNARIVIPEYFGDAKFQRVYVLFPDPWPKKRHIPNRLLSVDFLRLMAGVVADGGHFFTATDYWPYAHWTTDNLRHIDAFTSEGTSYFTTIEGIFDYRPSFFEKKWRDEGRAIYYMRYGKTPGGAV